MASQIFVFPREHRQLLFVLFAVSYGLFAFSLALAADWPMFGRDAHRNAVSPEQNLPLEWEIGKFNPENWQWIDDGAPVN